MLVSSLAVVAWGGQAPRYRLVDLSAEIGETYGGAQDINDAGQVLGWTGSGFGIWNPVGDGWVVTELDTHLPWCYWVDLVTAINNAGLAVGVVTCDKVGTTAVLWGKDLIDHEIDLGFPSDINDLGQVVGYENRAWFWDGFVETIDWFGGAYGINDHSEVVGQSHDGRAALWTRDARGEWQMTDLGTLGGAAAAIDLNELGQIVGQSMITSESWHAFLWQNGEMRDLGTLPTFDFSIASEINNAGQIVGYATIDGDWSKPHGFLWQEGTMWDLNDVVVSGPPLEFKRADAINEFGQIVGRARAPSGYFHAMLLDPIAAGDLDLDGDVDDTDLEVMLGSWGPCKWCDGCPADVDGDCMVGITDLLVLLGNWLP